MGDLTLLDRLEHFKQNRIDRGDEYGAEVIHHAINEIEFLQAAPAPQATDALRGIGYETHPSWNCSDEFNRGWKACRELMDEVLLLQTRLEGLKDE